MEISERQIVLQRHAYGSESELIELYLLEGPSELQSRRRISGAEWRFVFDYLVFEKDLLMKAVKMSQDFFTDIYVKYGIDHVRAVLDVKDSKYDTIFESVFDFLAIANDNLYRHLLGNKEKYAGKMREKGSSYVKAQLGIEKAKYAKQWETVLNVMLFAYCEKAFDERNMLEGMQFFAKLYNASRKRKDGGLSR